jgi:cyclophilin family peptidyl-prolyl cis-trans isomerase
VVAPAPHLDGSYTIFGEVVAGTETMMAINRLDDPKTHKVTGKATVTAAGCLASCDPRPEVHARCAKREDEARTIQNKKMHRCAD